MSVEACCCLFAAVGQSSMYGSNAWVLFLLHGLFVPSRFALCSTPCLLVPCLLIPLLLPELRTCHGYCSA